MGHRENKVTDAQRYLNRKQTSETRNMEGTREKHEKKNQRAGGCCSSNNSAHGTTGRPIERAGPV